MTSEVSICNRALQILGAPAIQALTDETKRAREMSTAYAPIRDAELYRRRWKFSIVRTSLAALASEPDHGYSTQYQLPNNCLRVVQIGEFDLGADLSDYRTAPTELFMIEGRKILTNLGAPLPVRYIAQITDASTFNPGFAEALSARIADETCQAITESDGKKQIAMAGYKRAIREATLANALESAKAYATDSSWISARAQ